MHLIGYRFFNWNILGIWFKYLNVLIKNVFNQDNNFFLNV